MDNLTYSYDSGNRLLKVADAANVDKYGFKDDALNTNQDTTNDYTYNFNGNIISDTNKDITNITYNHLNLPTLINFGSTNKIEYFYDALGVKQKKKVTEASSVTTTDYAGNYIYEDNTLKYFGQAEGYIENNNGIFSYFYQLKDHLGNIRVSYQDINQNNTSSVSLQIEEENNYYPFGLTHKGYNNLQSGYPFKYNGKELNEDLDLNWYDYGARNYDPALGRWHVLDAFAEKVPEMTPYRYAFNNPISVIDPDGNMESEIWDIGGGGDPYFRQGAGGYYELGPGASLNADGSITGDVTAKSPGKNGKKYQSFFRAQLAELEKEIANSRFEQENDVQTNNGESADYLLAKLIFHNQFGGRDDYNIDATTLDFNGTSQRELELTGMEVGDSRGVNLFNSGINANSLAFGKVTMTYQGDNMFSIESNKFDFDYQPNSSFKRNAGTFIGGAVFGQFFTVPINQFSIMRDVIGFGGSFMINFNGTVTVPK